MAAVGAKLAKVHYPAGELTVVKGIVRDYPGLVEEAQRFSLRPLTAIELDIAVMHEPSRLQLRDNAVRYLSGSFVIYRRKGRKFVEGEEIVDPYIDASGRRFVMLAEAIPSEAIGNAGFVFIERPVVAVRGGRVEISAPQGTGLFIPNVMYSFRNKGILHPETGLVVVGSGSEEQTRWIYIANEDRVVPVSRIANSGAGDKRSVCANNCPRQTYGVVLTSLMRDQVDSAAAEQRAGPPVLIVKEGQLVVYTDLEGNMIRRPAMPGTPVRTE